MFVILFLISSSHLPYLSLTSSRLLPHLFPSFSISLYHLFLISSRLLPFLSIIPFSSHPVFFLISSCFPFAIIFLYPLFPMLF